MRLLHGLFKQECALIHSWFKLLWHSFTQALHAVFYFFFKNIFFASRIFHESCFKAGNCYRPVNHGIVTSTTIPCWSISSLFHLRISQTGTAKNSQMQNRTVRLYFQMFYYCVPLSCFQQKKSFLLELFYILRSRVLGNWFLKIFNRVKNGNMYFARFPRLGPSQLILLFNPKPRIILKRILLSLRDQMKNIMFDYLFP